MKLLFITCSPKTWASVFILFWACSGLAAADVAIIVHPDNKVSVSAADISNIFLGRINSFPDGEKATPVVLKKGNPARSEFITKVLSQSEAKYKSHWSRLIFTGQATPPLELKSSEAILERVSRKKDAIAFIDAQEVTDDVRVVHVF